MERSAQCVLSLITAVLAALLTAASAQGTVYTWKDSAGVANYTNRQDEIPLRYRDKAKAIYPDPADASPAQQNTVQPLKAGEQPAVKSEQAPAAQRLPPPVIAAPPQPKTQPAPAARGRRNRSATSEE